ncbi:DUF625-domain-containing protein [Hesseltinella vesiculosa]|uniref:DUF625-domain-containing protein n=1 Tax=Hesseltinella vesiculosa TaxID=101127 RepID=A0A1X2GMF4_9FUNG|nr:DUF625-domain-containing protein [Hesseltinella vesiculosa]
MDTSEAQPPTETIAKFPQPSNSYRVKLFWLSNEDQWDDKGTGYCVYSQGIDAEPDEFSVQSEIDGSSLVDSKVVLEVEYQRQQDTLILWTENKQDYALSFQSESDCNDLWHRIQVKQDAQMATAMEGSTDDDDDFEIETTFNEPPQQPTNPLPDAELGNLGEIAAIVTKPLAPDAKERIVNHVLTTDYLSKLGILFESCEDLESTADLHTLYTIMKSLIMFSSSKLIKVIVMDDYITHVAGMLEYKPVRPFMKANYRNIIDAQTQMELAVPLNSDHIMTKIRETFRMQYLKDVILARSLNKELASALQHAILLSQMDIIDHIGNDHVFLGDLFDLQKQPSATLEQKQKVVSCVLQLISISKGLSIAQRTSLFRTLVNYGLFDILEVAITSEIQALRIAGVDALSSMVETDVSLARTNLLKHMEEKKAGVRETDLLDSILDNFASLHDTGPKIQYHESLKLLMESPNSMPGAFSTELHRKQSYEMDNLLVAFYDDHVNRLLEPFLALAVEPMPLEGSFTVMELNHDEIDAYSNLLEFLGFCVKHHSFRIRHKLINSDVFAKITQLYRCRYTTLRLDVLRFFRTVVGRHDDFYDRQLIKHQVFLPTVRVFLDTNHRDNLPNSAFLDLIDFVCGQVPRLAIPPKMTVTPKLPVYSKLLVSHLVETFGQTFETVTYVPLFKDMQELYDRFHKKVDSPTPLDMDADVLDGDEKARVSEERYFNESDDENEQFHTALDSFPGDDLAAVAVSPPLLPKHDSDDDDDSQDMLATKISLSKQLSPPPALEDEGAPLSMAADGITVDEHDPTPSSKPALPPLKRQDDDDDDDILAVKAKATRSPDSDLAGGPLASPKRRSVSFKTKNDAMAARPKLTRASPTFKITTTSLQLGSTKEDGDVSPSPLTDQPESNAAADERNPSQQHQLSSPSSLEDDSDDRDHDMPSLKPRHLDDHPKDANALEDRAKDAQEEQPSSMKRRHLDDDDTDDNLPTKHRKNGSADPSPTSSDPESTTNTIAPTHVLPPANGQEDPDDPQEDTLAPTHNSVHQSPQPGTFSVQGGQAEEDQKSPRSKQKPVAQRSRLAKRRNQSDEPTTNLASTKTTRAKSRRLISPTAQPSSPPTDINNAKEDPNTSN